MQSSEAAPLCALWRILLHIFLIISYLREIWAVNGNRNLKNGKKSESWQM
jgi:hypothetical protein